jgi:hypothetical protein
MVWNVQRWDGEQLFTMKSEVKSKVVDRPILFKVLTKRIAKDDDPRFQNFRVSFQKFHALFSTRLSQLG